MADLLAGAEFFYPWHVQIFQLLRGLVFDGPEYTGHPQPSSISHSHHSTAGNFLLHLPGSRIHCGRLQGAARATEVVHRTWFIRQLISSFYSGPDSKAGASASSGTEESLFRCGSVFRLAHADFFGACA